MAIKGRPEIWKPVVGFEGSYEVSDWGNVRSVERYVPCLMGNRMRLSPAKIKSQHLNKFGYKRLQLRKNNKYYNKVVHRLVAEAFIPNPNNLREVNHMHGNKLDNRYEFLEWCSPKENQQHALLTGLRDHIIGENHYNSKLTENDVYEIRLMLNTKKYTHQFIGDAYNISRTVVTRINNGTRGTHHKLYPSNIN